MTAEAQLDGFLAKYTPELAAAGRAARAKMRKRLPGAYELVYDNYNALVIGYAPSEKTSEAVLSLALYPRWVTLFFLQGAGLADPGGLLEGSGSQVRGIRLASDKDLDKPAVRALVSAAVAAAKRPFGKEGALVIKSISAKQRPRRPA